MVFYHLCVQIFLQIKDSGYSSYNSNEHLGHATKNRQWYGLNAFTLTNIKHAPEIIPNPIGCEGGNRSSGKYRPERFLKRHMF